MYTSQRDFWQQIHARKISQIIRYSPSHRKRPTDCSTKSKKFLFGWSLSIREWVPNDAVSNGRGSSIFVVARRKEALSSLLLRGLPICRPGVHAKVPDTLSLPVIVCKSVPFVESNWPFSDVWRDNRENDRPRTTVSGRFVAAGLLRRMPRRDAKCRMRLLKKYDRSSFSFKFNVPSTRIASSDCAI